MDEEIKPKALIYIEWVDASGNSSWMNQEEVKKWIAAKNWLVRQVGWVLEETEFHLVICGRLETDECLLFGQLQKIPKPWILKRQEITIDPT